MIGQIIKNMRLRVGLSQARLGKLLNMADTTISSYELEKTQADFETIMEIAKICNYEILIKDKEDDKIYSIKEFSKEMDF